MFFRRDGESLIERLPGMMCTPNAFVSGLMIRETAAPYNNSNYFAATFDITDIILPHSVILLYVHYILLSPFQFPPLIFIARMGVQIDLAGISL